MSQKPSPSCSLPSVRSPRSPVDVTPSPTYCPPDSMSPAGWPSPHQFMPSYSPSGSPWNQATISPSYSPSSSQWNEATVSPSGSQWNEATVSPSGSQWNEATVSPSHSSCNQATISPSYSPSCSQWNQATDSPTYSPSRSPLNEVTGMPNDSPWNSPTCPAPAATSRTPTSPSPLPPTPSFTPSQNPYSYDILSSPTTFSRDSPGWSATKAESSPNALLPPACSSWDSDESDQGW